MDPVEPVEPVKSNRGLVVAAALALALIVAAAAWWTYRSQPESISAYAGPPRYVVTPSLRYPSLRETAPPWPALAPGLRERLEGTDVPYGKDETTSFHTHQHLDVYVAGREVEVSASIGIDSAAGVISALHTHDPSGVIHVESPLARSYTLGQVFDIWGVRLTVDCLGSVCGSIHVFVNGKEISGDPRALVLERHQQITVSAGDTDVALPESYDFSDYS